MKIQEATSVNMNLLRVLVDIFFKEYNLHYKQIINNNPRIKDGSITQFKIDNPYDTPKYSRIISNYTDDQTLLDSIFELEFYLDMNGYKFMDGDKEAEAGATYHSFENWIKFYHPSYITPKLLAHELRHMMQYAQYEYSRNKNREKENKIEYRKKPIEIDAYWSDAFVDAIEFGVPEKK